MSNKKPVALITGASKGIGKGIALDLAANGWDVAINYHGDADGASQAAQEAVDRGAQAWTVQADVGYGEQVQRMFEFVLQEAGGIQLLVNNAGV
ncbi:MAG: SDR family NAD(P)-dependent oxidoreductase, partial [Pirellulaceae bacterium]